MPLKLTVLHKEEEHSTESITDFSYGVSRALSFAAMGKVWSAVVWEDTDKTAAGTNPSPFRGGVILYNTFWDENTGGHGVDYRTPYVRMRNRVVEKLKLVSDMRRISGANEEVDLLADAVRELMAFQA